MMVYEFSREDAYRFRSHVGIQAKEKGKELEFLFCPYCYGGKKKDKSTFSINLNTGQFECKRASCQAKGNMITLSNDFDFSLSEDMDRYLNRNGYNNRFRRFKKAQITVKDRAVEYLQKRGISEATVKKYQITVREDSENILVFPFFDEKDELRFIKYRKMDFDKERDRSKEWCEANCMPILYGMNQCTDRRRLVITEGQIDSLSLVEAGIKNAVSVPTGANGFTWIPHCWDWVNQFEEIVVFGDCENGNITLADTIQRRFSHKRIFVVREADYSGCKDANEILQKFGKLSLGFAVDNASVLPVKQIKELADVEAVDIEAMEYIRTNIPEVDDLLNGMYLGQLILLTGKRGEGKSTFMSQLVAEALEQDYNTFIYSGELVDFHFKRWLDLQVAGTHLKYQRLANGKETYSISDANINKINSWYRGRAFIYDNSVIDGEELEDLLTVTETAIKQYNVKFICIDNLMTAMEVTARDDLYRAQSVFVGKLAKLAKAYNVVILLVAHPRKVSGNISNDDISGSADITNKVDVVMSYSRDAEEADPDRRLLRITKNRLTGRLTDEENPIPLYYSSCSKRIVGSDKVFNREYGWSALTDGFDEVEDINNYVSFD